MRVTLIHNNSAGSGDQPSINDVLAALRSGGYQPEYCVSSDPDLNRALDDPGTMVVVAGGDGTVAQVAKRLAGRKVPIAVIPAGTANNIADSLKVEYATVEDLCDLDRSVVKSFDLGRAVGPQGAVPFIESIGCGLFVEMMVRFDAQKEGGEVQPMGPEDAVNHARNELRKMLAEAPATRCTIVLDGRDHSGSYVMVEVMNTGRIGPRLVLANTDPSDGLLDVVLVSDEHRGLLDLYLSLPASVPSLPPAGVEIIKAREVVFDAGEDRIHVDDEPRPAKEKPPEAQGEFQIALERNAVQFLVPKGSRL